MRAFHLFLFFTGFLVFTATAGTHLDKVYDSNIKTVLIHPMGNAQGLPIISLSAMTPLMISFDDLKATYQNYYYSVTLLNEDESPSNLNSFDYLQGFNQNRITQFAISSISIQSYYHYQFNFPNENCQPKQSGNYVLTVYKDANPKNIVFTRRFFVVEEQASILPKIQEPFDGNISRTHQKLQCIIDTKKLNYLQPDQLTVKVIQNYRYDDARVIHQPTFVRGNLLEYNNETDFIFPAGKEARWLDIQSLRLQSDRVQKLEPTSSGTNVYVKPDISRAESIYFNFKDLNGNFLIDNSESLNSDVQNDYATVYFTYIPPNRLPYVGQYLYLEGALTNNVLETGSEMQFDASKGVYQKKLLLKQGYYSYNYVLRDKMSPDPLQDFSQTEGDHWETENNYTILVYYRPPGARHDQIIGWVTANSKQNW